MADRTIKITCEKNLTSLNLCRPSIGLNQKVIIGPKSKCTARSFLYFDIKSLEVPEDAIIHYAVLKIYMKNLETDDPVSRIFAVPLINNFGKDTTFNEASEFSGYKAAVNVHRNFKGWLDIDVSEILGSWIDGTLENNGMALLSEEYAQSTSNILSDWASNHKLKPYLLFCYSFNCRPQVQKQIEVVEFCNEFKFIEEAFTPPVNIERLKIGTFFVTNMGDTALTVTLETSANRCDWVKDCAKVICNGGTEAIVGKFYGKYYRLKLATESLGQAEVQFIAQFFN